MATYPILPPLLRGVGPRVHDNGASVRAEQPDKIPDEEKGDEWYVLRDEPALRGTEVKNPEQNFDQGAGGSGQPIVTFEFSDAGEKKWERTTKAIAERGVSLFSLELMPRITRAQSMDILSSMATIAGYKAVLLAADALPKMFPMMMTAAGTIAPA